MMADMALLLLTIKKVIFENITALLSWHGKAASKADMVIAQLELFVIFWRLR